MTPPELGFRFDNSQVPGYASNSFEQIQQNGVFGPTSQLGDNIVLPIGDAAPFDASTSESGAAEMSGAPPAPSSVAGTNTGGGTTAAAALNATATALTLNALNGAGAGQSVFTGQSTQVADSGQAFSDAGYAGSSDDAVQIPEVVVTPKDQSPGFFSQLESAAGQALSGVGSFLNNFGKYAVGTTELAFSGVYNEGVRIVGGIASIPVAAFDSVDDAVALQQSIKNSIGYTPQTEGALSIEAALQPAGQYVDQHLLTPLHNVSETYLGDGLTTLLSGTAQFIAESAGVVGGIGAAESVVGRLVADGVDGVDAAAAAERVVPDEAPPPPPPSEQFLEPGQGSLSGSPEPVPEGANDEGIRGIIRQNQSARILSQYGQNVEQVGGPNPDYLLNGELADAYAPGPTSSLQNVVGRIGNKVYNQAPNVVLYLDDSPLTSSDIIGYVHQNPIGGLQKLYFIKNSIPSFVDFGT